MDVLSKMTDNQLTKYIIEETIRLNTLEESSNSNINKTNNQNKEVKQNKLPKCCICLEPFDTQNVIQAVIMECYHANTCFNCIEQNGGIGSSCPICRGPVQNFKRIFT